MILDALFSVVLKKRKKRLLGSGSSGSPYVAGQILAGPSPTGVQPPGPQPIPPVPGTPLNLVASIVNGLIVLTWTPVANATGYKVYRGLVSGGEVAYSGAGGPQWVDYGATPGTLYFYTVAAQNLTGTSPQSNEVSATAPIIPVPPVTTVGLTDASGNLLTDASGNILTDASGN